MKRLLAVAVVLLSAAVPLRAAPPMQTPNILIILSDDQSAPHLGCYGDTNLNTPRLDALAAGGMRFNRAYTTAPQCVPSRASILTGRSPVAVNMTRFTAPLAAEVVTLPDLLKKKGYFTGLMGRTHHLDGRPVPGAIQEAYRTQHLATMAARVDMENKDNDRTKAPMYFTKFLDAAQGKPFFLQFCYRDPHRPYNAGFNRDPTTLKLPAHYPDLPEVRADFASYYGEVERLDGDVGILLEILQQRGLADNTLVLFMGDNGAAQLRGKGTLYEFGLHVPLLVRWPGVVKPGATSDVLVSGEDITPTLLDVAGITPPKSMTGVSFLPALRGEKFASRTEVFGQRGAHGGGLPVNSAYFDLSRCIITDTHKLIYNALPEREYHPVDFDGGPAWRSMVEANQQGKLSPDLSRIYFQPKRPMFELYDLVSDPSEFHNLHGTKANAKFEHDLIERLAVWMLHERDFIPLPVGEPPAAPAAKKP